MQEGSRGAQFFPAQEHKSKINSIWTKDPLKKSIRELTVKQMKIVYQSEIQDI